MTDVTLPLPEFVLASYFQSLHSLLWVEPRSPAPSSLLISSGRDRCVSQELA